MSGTETELGRIEFQLRRIADSLEYFVESNKSAQTANIEEAIDQAMSSLRSSKPVFDAAMAAMESRLLEAKKDAPGSS